MTMHPQANQLHAWLIIKLESRQSWPCCEAAWSCGAVLLERQHMDKLPGSHLSAATPLGCPILFLDTWAGTGNVESTPCPVLQHLQFPFIPKGIGAEQEGYKPHSIFINKGKGARTRPLMSLLTSPPSSMAGCACRKGQHLGRFHWDRAPPRIKII